MNSVQSGGTRLFDGRVVPEAFIPGESLPNPIKGPKEALSPSAKAELKLLSGPRPARCFMTLAVTWLSIIAAILIAVRAHNIVVTVLAVYFVATRQNVLGLLLHEQVHYLCSRKPWADAILNLFAGWPLIVISVENYARIHLAHHAWYFTEKDPDFLRKNGAEWTFPMRVRFLSWLFLRDFIGGTFIAFVSGKNRSRKDLIKRPAALPLWLKLVYFLVMGGLIQKFGMWNVFLIYWVLPLLTILPAIVRFSAICEHKYNVVSGKLEESTAIIIPRWWENLLLPNLNFTYHIYHHYYPGVSFGNLPKVHEVFRREGLVDDDSVFAGYSSYFRRLARPEGEHPAVVATA